ncbi:MAG: SLBB domain-containing protein [Bacteroidaceae bacterium]|nr:SLBB domain-containing protein [Bacteroidaceae bacterium]
MRLESSFVGKVLLSAVIAFVSISSVSAQSAAELAAAKSMARSYGYSDAEIDEMMKKNNGMQSGNNASSLQSRSRSQSTQQRSQSTQQRSQSTQQRSQFDQQRPQSMQRPSASSQSSNSQVIGWDEVNDMPILADDVEMLLREWDPNYKTEHVIYGHDFFSSSGFDIIPSFNAPVPESYVLGPGDEVIIDIWGASTSSVIATIENDGSIPIEGLGPVFIAGQTVESAQSTLKVALSKIISDLGGSDPQSNIRVSVGEIKGVTVNVVGEVNMPGMYTLPSLSTIMSAIYMAEGIKQTASVRNIKLYRSGQEVTTFDLYDFIFNGAYDENLRLQDNDIIAVEGAGKLVKVSGAVNRPMNYEMKDDQTVADVLEYALGFKYNAVTENIHLERISSSLGLAYDIEESQYGSFQLENGDKITVKENRALFENRVTIEGAVMYPGSYSIGEGVSTVGNLIEAAGGLLEDAYKERGQINRMDEERRRVFVSFSINDVLAGSDINLVREDTVRIFTHDELRTDAYVRITGFVNNPGEFTFREGMTLGDIILSAGGFRDGADLSKIEVASIGYRNIGEVNNYNLEESPEESDAILKAYDVVSVRRQTYFRDPSVIELRGEVITPGTYVIDKIEVRLSDVFERAGGFTEEAYVKGSKLVRVLTPEEQENQRIAYEAALKNLGKGDSIDYSFLTDRYNVGIDLEKALKNPGSAADLVLRDGDIISVPQMNNVVRISGGVYVPTATSYDDKYKWKDYVSAAGGFTKQARKRKIYAIYMNGKIATRGRNFKMEPGMELVVPEKRIEEDRRMTAAEIAAIASTTSSVATLIVALTSILK